MTTYELTTKEGYKRNSRNRERINFVRVDEFDSLDRLTVSVIESIVSIQQNFNIIREWEEIEDNQVTKKILYSRPGKPGRLIRSFIVRRKKRHEWNDSLI